MKRFPLVRLIFDFLCPSYVRTFCTFDEVDNPSPSETEGKITRTPFGGKEGGKVCPSGTGKQRGKEVDNPLCPLGVACYLW